MTVTSNATGASVKIVTGAAVVAEGTISENGSYTTPVKLAPGTYTVTVSKIGFKEVTKTIIVDKDIIEAINLEAIPSVGNDVFAIDNVKVYIGKAFNVTSKDDVVIDGKPAKEITVRKDGSAIATAAENLTPGSKYEVKVFGSTYSIVAKPADTSALTLDLARALQCTKVEVVLGNEDGDDLSVLDPSSYIFDNGLKAEKVEYVVDDATGITNKSIVRVTTSMQKDGQAYKLKIDGMTDFAGNISKDTGATFAGIGEDKTAPEVASAVSEKGDMVVINLSDASQLDETTLKNAQNYYIDGLTIDEVVVKDNDLEPDSNKTVVLFTSKQTPTKVYTLKVGNLADVYGNKMTKTVETKVVGTELDTKAPEVIKASAKKNTEVKVEFDDSMDAATAQNPANYKIPGLTVTAAKLDKVYSGRLSELNGSVVTLTTSSQEAGKIYDVSVTNVKDAAGNVIADKNTAKFAGVAVDNVKPTIENATASASNKVVVTFSEIVDEKTALDPLNYLIDGNIGYPTSVRDITPEGSDVTKVVLVTANQEDGKIYHITTNSVKDTSGNVIAVDTKTTFIGFSDNNSALKVSSAVALNNKQVQVTFNKDVESESGVTKADFAITDNDKKSGVAIKAVYKVNNKTFILTLDDDVKFTSNVYTVEVVNGDSAGTPTENANILDFTGNGVAVDGNKTTFGGVTNAPVDPAIVSVAQKSANTLDVTFNQNVKVPSAVNTGKNDGSIVLAYGDQTIEGSVDAITEKEGKTNITIVLADKIPSKTTATLKIKSSACDNFTDVTGNFKLKAPTESQTLNFTFGTGEYKAAGLKIAHAEAVDSNTIDITYNQPIKASGDVKGAYQIKDKDGKDIVDTDGKTLTATVVKATKISDKTIRAYFTVYGGKTANALPKNTVYRIETTASGKSVTDLDGKIYAADGTTEVSDLTKSDDLKAQFGASSVKHAAAQLISAEVLDESHIKVMFSEAVGTDAAKVAAGDFVLLYGPKLDQVVSSNSNAFDNLKCVDDPIKGSAGGKGAVYVLELNSTTVKGAVFTKDVKYAVAYKEATTPVKDGNGVADIQTTVDGKAVDTSNYSNAIQCAFGGIAPAHKATAKAEDAKLTVKIDDNGASAAKVGVAVSKSSDVKTMADAKKAEALKSVDLYNTGSGADVLDGQTIAAGDTVYVYVEYTDALGHKITAEYTVVINAEDTNIKTVNGKTPADFNKLSE